MINITAEQYDLMYIAARNLQGTANNDDDSWYYKKQLTDYTVMLTGKYPEKDVVAKATDLAKTILYEDHREEIDKIVELFIGPFKYEPNPPTEEEIRSFVKTTT